MENVILLKILLKVYCLIGLIAQLAVNLLYATRVVYSISTSSIMFINVLYRRWTLYLKYNIVPVDCYLKTDNKYLLGKFFLSYLRKRRSVCMCDIKYNFIRIYLNIYIRISIKLKTLFVCFSV